MSSTPPRLLASYERPRRGTRKFEVRFGGVVVFVEAEDEAALRAFLVSRYGAEQAAYAGVREER